MLEREIGPDYAGVLVSDFYTASTGYEGRHQYCWAHLLRNVDDLVAQHRQDAAVVGWADGVRALYQRATRAATLPEAAARRQERQACEAALTTLCAPYLGVTAVPQRVLCERITRHLPELFVFVEDPCVPPTNNAAERVPPLILRAVTRWRRLRSAAGTATTMTLASLFGTWRLHGLDPLAECRALLANPQL